MLHCRNVTKKALKFRRSLAVCLKAHMTSASGMSTIYPWAQTCKGKTTPSMAPAQNRNMILKYIISAPGWSHANICCERRLGYSPCQRFFQVRRPSLLRKICCRVVPLLLNFLVGLIVSYELALFCRNSSEKKWY